MFTSLDFIVVTFMALVASSVLSTALMFLIKNNTARRVFFFITVTIGLVAAYIGASIGSYWFPVMTGAAVFFGSCSVGAMVLFFVKRKNEKVFLIARIVAAAALVFGIINAFLI